MLTKASTETKPLFLDNGTTEALKWFSLILMVADHVNKYLCNGTIPWIFQIARLSFPLFGFVLAYNLARENTLTKDAAKRIMQRLFAFSFFATIPHYLLDDRWLPVNILATLLASTATIYLYQQAGLKKWIGVCIFLASGFFVEGNWFAVAVVIMAYYYCKSPKILRLIWFIVSICVLGFLINLNQYGLAVVPIILIAPYVHIQLKRYKHVFYWFYPSHLVLILAIKEALSFNIL